MGDNGELRATLLSALSRAKQETFEPSQVTDDKKLREDLGLDSLSMVELVWDIEDKLGIHIDDNSLRTLVTVGDVVTHVSGLVAAKDEARV